MQATILDKLRQGLEGSEWWVKLVIAFAMWVIFYELMGRPTFDWFLATIGVKAEPLPTVDGNTWKAVLLLFGGGAAKVILSASGQKE